MIQFYFDIVDVLTIVTSQLSKRQQYQIKVVVLYEFLVFVLSVSTYL